MKIAYNCDKTSLAEHSLKGNIVPDAKRTENFTSLPWRAQPDSLRRNLSYSSVLQKAEIKMVFAKTGLFSPTFQLLSSSRVNPGHSLCFDCWDPPLKQIQNSSGQWCLSADHRSHEVPLCQQSKAIPKTSPSQNHPEHQQGSRPLKAKDVLSSQASDQSSVRFRISPRRLLARPLEARERLYLFRCPRVPQGMPWENSTRHLSHPSTNRFRFLRSQIYRA